jgi:hypothetical protein
VSKISIIITEIAAYQTVIFNFFWAVENSKNITNQSHRVTPIPVSPALKLLACHQVSVCRTSFISQFLLNRQGRKNKAALASLENTVPEVAGTSVSAMSSLGGLKNV